LLETQKCCRFQHVSSQCFDQILIWWPICAVLLGIETMSCLRSNVTSYNILWELTFVRAERKQKQCKFLHLDDAKVSFAFSEMND
jgi:hypothetical protein